MEKEKLLIYSTIFSSEAYMMNKTLNKKDKSSDEIKKQCVSTIKQIGYSKNKSGKESGILFDFGKLKEVQENYNKSFMYNRNRDVCSYIQALDYDNPFAINDIYSEYSEDKLNDSTYLEILAKTMNLINMAAKTMNTEIRSMEKANNQYNSIFSEVLKIKDLDDFFQNHIDMKDKTNEQIQEELEDEAEQYNNNRKIIAKAMSSRLGKTVTKKEQNEFIDYATMRKARQDLYSTKENLAREIILQVEKDPNAKHYVTRDLEKEKNLDSLDLVYGFILPNYTEPYEIHMQDNLVSTDILLAEKELKREIQIPLIEDRYIAIKTKNPHKLNKKEKDAIQQVLNWVDPFVNPNGTCTEESDNPRRNPNRLIYDISKQYNDAQDFIIPDKTLKKFTSKGEINMNDRRP